jgi:5-methylcytosine-specific restriction endonuclease McrA
VNEHHQLIHRTALDAAQGYRRAESTLVDALMAVDRERVFLQLGHASLFVYAVQALGLSEAVAYNAITVARKAREVPALQEQIRAGKIGISKAKKIASVLTLANQSEWLDKAATLSSRQIEKEVAKASPREAAPESARYVSEKRLELRLGIEEAQLSRLRRAQDRVSQSQGRAVSLEETLQIAVDFYLNAKDPLEKAKRAVVRRRTVAVEGSPTERVDSRFTGTVRAPIPAVVKHRVLLRDGAACQFRRPDGLLCGAQRWVDTHHLIPVSEGGAHAPENLQTLCRAHHREVHRRTSR